MRRWNPSARELDRLRALVLQLHSRHCDVCGPVAPPDGWAHCVLCHELIDLRRPHTDPLGYSLQHVIPRAHQPHLTRAQDLDPRGLRPAHLVCNQRALDRVTPTRQPWSLPGFSGRPLPGRELPVVSHRP